VTEEDLERERKVEAIVAENLERWQEEGLVPDMAIEPGDETTRLHRERGWMYWHQLFNARQLLSCSCITARLHLKRYWSRTGPSHSAFDRSNRNSLELCRSYHDRTKFALCWLRATNRHENASEYRVFQSDRICNRPAVRRCGLMYHEITEYFIAWLRKNPPPPFDEWTWDSRRALAIKGSGDDFRRGMVDAYRAMTDHMPDNGMQCVMFTHQDTGVWSDMVSIFWAAGLQVVGAWYIATETTSELKKGGYVQGTVILMLRKRPPGDRPASSSASCPRYAARWMPRSSRCCT
jgi:putative DNA methylase